MVEGATSFGLVMYVLNNCLNIGKKPSLGERELVSCGIGNECQSVVSRHVKEICMVVCVCVWTYSNNICNKLFHIIIQSSSSLSLCVSCCFRRVFSFPLGLLLFLVIFFFFFFLVYFPFVCGKVAEYGGIRRKRLLRE